MFVLVVGGGQVGESLVQALTDEEQEVALIERDRRRYESLMLKFPESAIFGNATEIAILRRAGIERADALAIVTGEDTVNLVVSEIARQMFNITTVVARVNDPGNFELFRQAGVTSPVSSTHILMAAIHQEMEPGVIHRLASVSGSSDEVMEIVVTERAPSIGQAVWDLALPPGALVVALRRGGTWSALDRGVRVKANDVLLVIAPIGSADELRHALCAPAATH